MIPLSQWDILDDALLKIKRRLQKAGRRGGRKRKKGLSPFPSAPPLFSWEGGEKGGGKEFLIDHGLTRPFKYHEQHPSGRQAKRRGGGGGKKKKKGYMLL